MTDLSEPLPYGLRNVMLTPFTDAAGTILGTTSVQLPVAQTFSFKDSEDFEDLRGDDRLVTSHGKGAQVAWELDAGGMPFAAYKIMAGGTVTASGTTPARKVVYSKKLGDLRPFFRVEGTAISDSGGDVHCVVYRCKATGDLSGEFADGAFWLTAASGTGYYTADVTGNLYDFVQNETPTAFVEPNPGS